MTFEEECVEWLKPFGYEIHSFNPDKTLITFMNYEKLDSSFPIIKCNAQNKTATISDSLKLFITLSVTIQFKHPDIERYIETFRYYTCLCEKYPPF